MPIETPDVGSPAWRLNWAQTLMELGLIGASEARQILEMTPEEASDHWHKMNDMPKPRPALTLIRGGKK